MTLAVSSRFLSLLTSIDVEQTMLRQLKPGTIQASSPVATWSPGNPLSLLLVGAVGIGNVGADMRSGEIVRQLRLLLGVNQVDLNVLATGEHWPCDLMLEVGRRDLGADIAESLANDIASHHGVVACEGSMFKSTFSNALSALMASALGSAAMAGKLSVGYGAEVGRMDATLESFVAENLNGALILCRNQQSLRSAERLRLRVGAGADTAWTFEAASREYGLSLLRTLGWNGHDSLLVVCPNNPFWWPVRPEPRMAYQMQRTGRHKDLFYGLRFLFHTSSPDAQRKYKHYLDQLSTAIRHIALSRQMTPVLIAMDRADECACNDLAERLGSRVPILLGYRHSAAGIVAVLRLSRLLLSARFHALVGAMPSAVPSIGIAMDERIRNLLADDQARLVEIDDPELAGRLIEASEHLDADAIRASSRNVVAAAIESMGRMGMAFRDEVTRLLPDFPLPDLGKAWESYLPPLPQAVIELLS